MCAPSEDFVRPLEPSNFESQLFVESFGGHELTAQQVPGLWDSFVTPAISQKILHRAWITAGSVLPANCRQTDAMVASIQQHCGPELFDIIFIFQVHAAVFVMEAARRLVAQAGRIVVDWDAAERPAAAAQYRMQKRKNATIGKLASFVNDLKLARYERYLLDTADITVCASDYDVDYFISRKPRGAVRTIPNCIDVPNEVLPMRASTLVPCFLFVGLINYWPNRSGLQSFIKEVWPRIRQRFPDAEFRIVGRGMTDDIAAWHGIAGIDVVGAVDDLSRYYAGCDVVVVPMRFSVGSSIKILESLAYCRPAVAFEASAKRHHLRDGEHMCIVSDNDAFVEKMIWLIENRELATEMARRGYDLVREYYSRSRVQQLVCDLVSEPLV